MAPLLWEPLHHIFGYHIQSTQNLVFSSLFISFTIVAVLLVCIPRPAPRQTMDRPGTADEKEDTQPSSDVTIDKPDPPDTPFMLDSLPDLDTEALGPLDDPLAGVYFPITSGQLAAMAGNSEEHMNESSALEEIQQFMAETTSRQTSHTPPYFFAQPDFMRISQGDSGQLWSRKIFHTGDDGCEACAGRQSTT